MERMRAGDGVVDILGGYGADDLWFGWFARCGSMLKCWRTRKMLGMGLGVGVDWLGWSVWGGAAVWSSCVL